MMPRAIFIVLLLYPAVCFAAKPLRACGGQSEWPPSSYYADKQKRTITGYSADVLHKIFDNTAYQIEIQLLPWPRCLAEVQNGENYQIAMAVSRTPERETKFIFSTPYLFLTPGSVSLNSQHPRQGNISTLSKCGINGFNYNPYDMFNSKDIDTTANNYESVIKKLIIGRCDYLLEYTEVAQSLIRLEEYGFTKGTFKIEKILGAKLVPAHFAIGENAPDSKKILAMVNEKLIQLEKKGKLKSLINKHMQ